LHSARPKKVRCLRTWLLLIERTNNKSYVRLYPLGLPSCLFVSFPASHAKYGRALSQGNRRISQEQQKVPLGSLSSVGECMSTTLWLHQNRRSFPAIEFGRADRHCYIYGKWRGSLKIISPQTRCIHGNYQFIAELEAGTVVLNSIAVAVK